MKLNRLAIHNIASFEEAVIDFGEPPLSNADLFLIAGKTGSGKTTILDSICLALYNEVPRLHDTRMQGRVADGPDLGGANDIGIDDTRQMVRRATGEASVVLTFTGNDGRDYEARWGVRRARGRVEGRFQKLEWSVTSLADGSVWSKQNDVREKILETVGLDFEQFCRTTMLAQGDFARFLNSNDNDKADLLEKITGTGIYTAVGRKVFDIFSSWKKRWEAETEKAEMLEREAVRPAEEIAAVRQAILEDRRVKSGIEKKIVENAARINWLVREKTLSVQVEKAAEAFRVANGRYSSVELENARNFITLRDRTLSARRAMEQREEDEKKLAGLDTEISGISLTFRRLKGCAGRFERKLAMVERDVGELGKSVREDEPYAGIYSRQQTVSASIGAILRQRVALDEETATAAKRKETIAALRGMVNPLTEREREKSREREAVARTLATEKNALEEINPLGLAKDLSDVDSAMREITSLRNLINRKGELVMEREKVEARLSSRLKELEAEDRRLDELRTLRDEATVAAEAAARLYGQVKMQSEEWAVQCRASLRVGDGCPVCGKIIETPFPLEDAISRTVENARIPFEEKQEALRRLTAEYAERSAAARGARSMFERESNRERTRLDVADKELLSAICESSLQLGLETEREDLPAVLERLGGQMADRKKELLAARERGKCLEKKIKETERHLEILRKEWEVVASELGSVKERMAAETAAAVTGGNIMTRMRVDIENHFKELRDILIPLFPEEEWIASLTDFDERLKREAGLSLRRAERLRELQEERRELAGLISKLRTTLDETEKVMEGWNLLEPDGPYAGDPEPDMMLAEAAGILSEATRLSALYGETLSRIKTAENTVEAFLAGNSDIDRGNLIALASAPDEEETRLRKLCEDTALALRDARNIFESRKLELESHRKNRPEMEETVTIECLESVAEALRGEADEVTRRIGERSQIINQNEEKSRRLSEIRRQVVEIEKDMRRWERLSGIIGDSEGKRFRRIAQSFVLGTLVRNANAYLRELSARYELSVQPGSFVVMLEDAWQGYARRPASTLSGGESFLVSLSLALALSDIGQLATVDTLFIDEGFGTLSGQPLRNAVATLRTLRDRRGRHVGIISHIEELRESVPVRIEVDRPSGASASTVKVV